MRRWQAPSSPVFRPRSFLVLGRLARHQRLAGHGLRDPGGAGFAVPLANEGIPDFMHA